MRCSSFINTWFCLICISGFNILFTVPLKLNVRSYDIDVYIFKGAMIIRLSNKYFITFDLLYKSPEPSKFTIGYCLAFIHPFTRLVYFFRTHSYFNIRKVSYIITLGVLLITIPASHCCHGNSGIGLSPPQPHGLGYCLV